VSTLPSSLSIPHQSSLPNVRPPSEPDAIYTLTIKHDVMRSPRTTGTRPRTRSTRAAARRHCQSGSSNGSSDTRSEGSARTWSDSHGQSGLRTPGTQSQDKRHTGRSGTRRTPAPRTCCKQCACQSTLCKRENAWAIQHTA
jgi:hypothetical protein